MDHPGTCQGELPGGCCNSDDECGEGSYCAYADPWGIAGVCKVKPPNAGTCWTSQDCDPGKICQGALVCPCGDDCDQDDLLGICMSEPLTCCEIVGGCGDGLECSDGNCVPAVADPGQCWNDGDCQSGQTCFDAFVCPCTAKCAGPSHPGTCQGEIPGGCCQADLDCQPGQQCTGMTLGGSGGVCKDQGSQDACWTDADCGAGQVCEDESICPCGALCFFGGDWPGKCSDGCSGPNPAGCVSTGCPQGEKCVPVNACIPSACSCSAGTWICTADCEGGACAPEP
jgi:hypothetical protein